MNLAEVAPLWLLLILCAALVMAATEDILRLRISNAIPLVIVTGAAIGASLHGLSLALWENLLVGLGLLVGGTMIFATGRIGGGDVKLLAAVGSWMDFERAVMLLTAVFLSGGILAILVLTARFLRRRSRKAIQGGGNAVPYGVAIVIGTLIVIGLQPRATPQSSSPLEFPSQGLL